MSDTNTLEHHLRDLELIAQCDEEIEHCKERIKELNERIKEFEK